METLARFFGFGSRQEAPRPTRPAKKSTSSLEDLQAKIELLEKRENVLAKRVEDEFEKAKQFHSKKNTTGALQCMKRRKMLQDQLASLADQRQNLEVLMFTVQNQAMNMEVLETQRRAKDELKSVNERMGADRVDETMDDLMEEMDKANTVTEALRQPLDSQLGDEDELLAELMGDMANVGVPHTAQAVTTLSEILPSMPTVPRADLPKQINQVSNDDEEALRELERELLS